MVAIRTRKTLRPPPVLWPMLMVLILILLLAGPAAAQTYVPGTHVSSLDARDDAYDGPYEIGFDFPFFGTTRSQFYVTTNGVVSFGGGSSSFSNSSLPTMSYNYPAVFPFWDDLHPTGSGSGLDGHILYQTIAAGEHGNPYGVSALIVQWTNYGFFASPLVHGTFQVHLVADGTIVFNYNDLIEPTRSYGQSATIGIQQSGGGSALQHSHDEDAGIRSGYAIVFDYEAPNTYITDGEATTGFWDIRLFKGAVPPPAKPENPNPAEGEITSTSPTLRWSVAAGADLYRVRVSVNANLSGPVYDELVDTNMALVTGLAEDTTYYWQVVARNDAGDAPSDLWHFITSTVQVHALTYLAGEGGSIAGDAMQTVPDGEDGTRVTAIPEDGYVFVRWSDGLKTARRTDTNVTADLTVTAEFRKAPLVPPQHLLRVLADPPGLGTVLGGGFFDEGAQVTVSAEAHDGYQFVSWLERDQVVSQSATYSFRLTAYRTLTATFGEIPTAPGPYILGYPDGSFRPSREMTRAEMAALLWRLQGNETSPAGTSGYPDVSADHWAAGAIAGITDLGLMAGYPDGLFHPDRSLTRGEAAMILATWLGLEGSPSHSYPDVEGHWAETAVALVCEAGLMRGYPDGSFRPNGGLTRAEAVTIINRAQGHWPLTGVTQPTWSDVPPGHWAFGDIERASIQN